MNAISLEQFQLCVTRMRSCMSFTPELRQLESIARHEETCLLYGHMSVMSHS